MNFLLQDTKIRSFNTVHSVQIFKCKMHLDENMPCKQKVYKNRNWVVQ
jgi:hypothetical protein